MPAIRKSIKQVKHYWKEKGPLATTKAIVETLVSPLFRHRQRLVFDIDLTALREPSVWGPGENLLVFGPENIESLCPELLATMEPAKHWKELQDVRRGNRLFVVKCGGQCIYRSYIRMIDTPGPDRKAVFFGGLEAIPEIRQAVMTTHFRGKDLYKQVRKGLHTRVVNEQLRHLQSIGHRRAVLYIMAGNRLSIKGNTAAGFQMVRTLDDWIVLNAVVFQHISENGRSRWRVFFQRSRGAVA
jgi:hypothetical protein